MSSGITLAKIVVLSALLAIYFGAAPALDLMRRHAVWPLAQTQEPVAAMTPTPTSVKTVPRAARRVTRPARTAGVPMRKASKKKANASFDAYQVPAGTVLTGLLRAPLDSATARVEAPVRALLRSTLRQEGMELIPAASIIHGKVVDVIPASRWQPRGRIVLAFSSIEHSGTSSRIAIRAHHLVLEPIDAIGSSVKRTADVRVNAGELLPITLTESLVVRLPK